MTKILKSAAVVAGLAVLTVATGGTFLGISTAAGGILGLGAVASAAIAGAVIGAAVGGLAALTAPSIADLNQQAGSKFAVTGQVDTYKKVYGKNRIGGFQAFIQAYDATGGDDVPNDTLVFARVVAGHPINSFGTFRIADKVVAFDGSGNAVGEFKDHLYLKTYDGTQGAADPWLTAAGAGWGASHIGTGVSYCVVKAIFDAEKFPYGASELQQASIEIEGAKLYDHRLDSTQTAIGGSGSHRFADPTTWEYSVNPALATYDTLKDPRLGVVVPDTAIDIAAVVALANHCDEDVTVKAGGTIDRYTLNGVVDSGRSKLENIKLMLTSCAGRLGWNGGRVTLHGTFMTASTYSFDEDSIKGVTSYSSLPPLETRYNTVNGSFISPDDDFNSVEYPASTDSALVASEGEIAQPLNLPYTQDHRIAQRLANIARLIANRPVMQLNLEPVGLISKPWDIITVTWPNLAITAQTFRVLDHAINPDSESDFCTVSLNEYDATITAWTAATDELDRSAPVALTASDPTGTVGNINSDIIDGASQTLIKDAWFNKQSGNLSANKAWTATTGWSFPTAKVTLPTGQAVKVATHDPVIDDYEYPTARLGEIRYDGGRLVNQPFFVSPGEIINVAVYGTATTGTDGTARVGLAFYGGNGVFIEERVNDDPIPPAINSWGSVRRLLTAPPGSVFAEFFIVVSGHRAGQWTFTGVDAIRVALGTDINWQSLAGGDIAADLITADQQGFMAKRWDFAGDGLGWTFTNITVNHTTLAAEITTTSADPQLTSPATVIDGGLYNLVWVRMKRRVVGSQGRYDKIQLFYSTSGHGFSNDYTVQSLRRFLEGQYVTFVFDMNDLLRGGSDWADNTVTQLRFDPSASAADEFDIDYIGYGRATAAALEGQAVNVADPLAFVQVAQTDTDLDEEIGNMTLAAMGLAIGDPISVSLALTGSGSRKGRIYMNYDSGSKLGDLFAVGSLATIEGAIIPAGTTTISFWLGRENGVSGTVGAQQLMVVKGAQAQSFVQFRADVAENATNTTNTNQLTDGANLGTTAVWTGVTGTGKPADNATNTTDTNQLTDSANLGDTAVWTGVTGTGKPADNATNTTNTNQLTDGANLGDTAVWASVTGTGKPADNATNNTGALADVDNASWVTGGTVATQTLKNGTATTDITVTALVEAASATARKVFLQYMPMIVLNAGTSEELQVEFRQFMDSAPSTPVWLETRNFIVKDDEFPVPISFTYEPTSQTDMDNTYGFGIEITAVDATYDVNVEAAEFNLWQNAL